MPQLVNANATIILPIHFCSRFYR